jgi:hypothetical protein
LGLRFAAATDVPQRFIGGARESRKVGCRAQASPVSRKKSAQACDELIDEGAIITGE